jgi:hypothetical protein
MLQLFSRCLLTSTEYRLYRFSNSDRDYSYMLNFLTNNAMLTKVQPALNDPHWKLLLANKWLFYLHCKQFDLPLPEVYGIYDRRSGLARNGKSLAKPEDLLSFFWENRPPALVVKPLGGILGKHVLILNEIHYEGDVIQAVTNTGKCLTFAALTELLEGEPDVGYFMGGGYKLDLSGYLLQEKLQQHPLLNEIAPYTTNTVRVVTFLDHNNEVDVHFTILRLGRRGNAADNWDRGGISVAVDPASGVLGEGVIKPKYGGQWLQAHPDSGVRFTGRQLPHWLEVLTLCSRAARVTPKVRSVGWDIALTPSGPVIIEGNPDWDLPMVQVHTAGLLQPSVREKLSHFGLSFPETKLPPPRLSEWWRRLRIIYRAYGLRMYRR